MQRTPQAAHLLCVTPAGKALLVCKQKKRTHKPIWILPGGKREQNESLRNALAREIAEEIQARLDHTLVRFGDFTGRAPNSRGLVTTRVYVGSLIDEPRPANEIVDVRFVSLAEAHLMHVSSLTKGVLLEAVVRRMFF